MWSKGDPDTFYVVTNELEDNQSWWKEDATGTMYVTANLPQNRLDDPYCWWQEYIIGSLDGNVYCRTF